MRPDDTTREPGIAMSPSGSVHALDTPVCITHRGVSLHADITRPPGGARGTILFAHGSGSSRLSRRNRWVASRLVAAGFATVLLDLLTEDEDRIDRMTREYRFDIPRLARRLAWATEWLAEQPAIGDVPIGYFGASTGAAAALIAAAGQQGPVAAVVSRGGRPDLAKAYLPRVRVPTLLIIGGHDPDVLALNRAAAQQIAGLVKIEIIRGATHLFEEPGALEEVSTLACDWFIKYLV